MVINLATLLLYLPTYHNNQKVSESTHVRTIVQWTVLGTCTTWFLQTPNRRSLHALNESFSLQDSEIQLRELMEGFPNSASTIRRRTLPLFDANWSGTKTRLNGKPLHTSIDGIHIILFAAFGNQQTGSWNDDVITSPSVRRSREEGSLHHVTFQKPAFEEWKLHY